MHSTSFRTSRTGTSTATSPRTFDLPPSPKEAVSPLPSFGSVFQQGFITIHVSRDSTIKASYINFKRPSAEHVPQDISDLPLILICWVKALTWFVKTLFHSI